MGDFQPEAHVNGSLGWSLIAFICSRNSAVFTAVFSFKIMAQMYCKVFINKVSLVFSDQPENDCISVPSYDGKDGFLQWIETLYEMDEVQCFQIQHNHEDLWQAFKSHHTIIEAAGGLVTDAKNRLLVIKRLGMWDLPKGKLEEGEEIEKAAVREVEEECGITDLTLIRQLPDTYHCYRLRGKHILKRTYWFEMQYKGSEMPTPQIEEDISEVIFMDANQVEHAKQHTYPSLLPIFNAYSGRHK
jgi:8-oxo-dGTP pyrophosphatase MutT (NUDIX family)